MINNILFKQNKSHIKINILFKYLIIKQKHCNKTLDCILYLKKHQNKSKLTFVKTAIWINVKKINYVWTMLLIYYKEQIQTQIN